MQPPQPVAGPSAASLRDLCARAAMGEERAFAALHARLGNGLRRFLMKRAGRDEIADDLAQRAWLAAWQALRDGRYDAERAAFTTFLYGVGYKLWLQHVRASASMPVGHDGLDELANDLFDTADPAEFLRTCELLDAVRSFVREGSASGLSVDERRLLDGVARGLSEREMARELGLAPSTVNARKRLVLNKLREHLDAAGHATPEMGSGEH
jgi:RNA polymerase sigma factor (sigma-70 family)